MRNTRTRACVCSHPRTTWWQLLYATHTKAHAKQLYAGYAPVVMRTHDEATEVPDMQIRQSTIRTGVAENTEIDWWANMGEMNRAYWSDSRERCWFAKKLTHSDVRV
jgi:hypothetical protein